MKKVKVLTSFLFLSMVIFSCKKSEKLETQETLSKPNTLANSQPRPAATGYGVDVVYLLPQGFTAPIKDYATRLNSIRNLSNDFFIQNMTKSGYGAEFPWWFSIDGKDNVYIRVVSGKLSIDKYVEGDIGFQLAADEVDAALANSKDIRGSKYKIIVLPGVKPNSYTYKYLSLPCVGPKNTAFLCDYPGFEATEANKNNVDFQKAIGFFFHELGHAFGLEHNNGKFGEISANPLLMAASAPTYTSNLSLSSADSQILHLNQAFNSNYANYRFTNDNEDDPQFRVTSMDQYFPDHGYTNYTQGPFEVLNGSYTSSISVSSIIVYYDPNQQLFWNRASNSAKIWATLNQQGNTSGKFSIDIPDSYTYQMDYKRLNLLFLLKNGSIVKRSYGVIKGDTDYSTETSPTFARKSGFVNHDFGDLDRYDWTIKSTSRPSQVVDNIQGRPEQLLDNHRYTAWYPGTRPDGKIFPNELTIDCKKVVTAKALWMTSTWYYGFYFPIQFMLQGSSDGVNFYNIGTFERRTIEETYGRLDANNPQKMSFSFSGPQSFRYLKFMLVKPLGGNKQTADWLGITELGLSK